MWLFKKRTKLNNPVLKEKQEIIDMTTENKIFLEEIPVLDKGFVKLYSDKVLGDDELVCEAARVSYKNNEKTYSYESNRRLLSYLCFNKHTSPFEMGTFIFVIKAPLFIIEQFKRYRTASINQQSYRYTNAADNDFYVVPEERCTTQSEDNKQQSTEIKVRNSKHIVKLLYNSFRDSLITYKRLIDNSLNKEIARTVLPNSTYSTMYFKIDLHNLFNILRQRLDVSAQKEIQEYSKAMYELAKQYFPISFEIFDDKLKLDAVHKSVDSLYRDIKYKSSLVTTKEKESISQKYMALFDF